MSRAQLESRGPGARHDLPGMSWDDFFASYGGSLRTKNLRGRSDLPRRSLLPKELIRLDPWEAEYVYMLAQLATRGIVEIGRFRGGSTFLLACANAEVPIWSIDLTPADDDELRRLLDGQGRGANVRLLVGDSHAGSFPDVAEYDLVFVDGDHTREGCLADLERFVPGLASGGHLAVHDCYAEFEVQQAVLEFADRAPLRTVRSPYNRRSHWQTDAGSIAHFVKRGANE